MNTNEMNFTGCEVCDAKDFSICLCGVRNPRQEAFYNELVAAGIPTPEARYEASLYKDCPNCGPEVCYHICPNSPAYYTPEQERYDDQFYGDDRYEGWGDPEIYEEPYR